MQNYKLTHFKIIRDPDWVGDQYQITPEMQQLVDDLEPRLDDGGEEVIRELRNCCKRFPHFPHFKKMLMGAYENTGQMEEAMEISEQMIREHPEYLHGRLSMALLHLLEGSPERVPDILGESLNLKDLYPERTGFHVSEVIPFFGICTFYYFETDQIEQALEYLNIMQQIGPEDPLTLSTAERYTEYLGQRLCEK